MNKKDVLKLKRQVIADIKKMYSWDKDLKIEVTDEFKIGYTFIHGAIRVNTKVLYIKDIQDYKSLKEGLQSIIIRNNNIDFNIVSKGV